MSAFLTVVPAAVLAQQPPRVPEQKRVGVGGLAAWPTRLPNSLSF